MGEVHTSIEQVAAKFESRARQSLTVSVVFGAVGILSISSSVGRIDESGAALAVFIIGVHLCSNAITMIIGWGAAGGHSTLARLGAEGHEKLHGLLGKRLDGIEAIERKTGEAVVIAMDDLRQRRSQRG
jgi:hypothetical protein